MSEHIDRIIDELTDQKFVVFAGTGVVGETGVSPSWKRLLQKFREEEPESVVDNLDVIEESEYPRVAQNIYDRLRLANKEERYYEVLHEGLRATNAPHSAQEIDIVRTAKHVITTNFENTFESALNFELEDRDNCNHTIQRLPDLRIGALFGEYSISYVHGSVDEKHVIFKENDYKHYYPSQFKNIRGSDVLERFLRNIYEEHTIVFIGFGFSDKHLLKALQTIRADMARNDAEARKRIQSYKPRLEQIQHYAFMHEFCRDVEEKALNEQFQNREKKEIEAMMQEKENMNEILPGVLGEIGIKVIPYKQHRDWMDWFKKIRENQKGIQSAKYHTEHGTTQQ